MDQYLTKNSLVTIVVPFHNAEEYLESCVMSIINQFYQNMEVFLINDHSDDKSVELAEKFCLQDNRLNLIDSKLRGVSAARNLGIELAHGEFITFIDADDMIEKEFISELLKGYDCQDVDLSVCTYDNNLSQNAEKVTKIDMVETNEFLKELFLPSSSVGSFVWNKLYNVKLIKQYNLMFDETISTCEDTLFNFNYLKHCYKVNINYNDMYHYRINKQGLMYSKGFNQQKLTGNKAFTFIINSLDKEKNLKLEDQAKVACMLFNLILIMQLILDSNIEKHTYFKEIYQFATMDIGLFFKSNVHLKYKLGLIYVVLYKIKNSMTPKRF
ncbi:MAG: glycosyltransferase [Staphylococcus hyicus]|uniref:glycosyltransferase family 2 protein n=1 Tax=Staphylococcus hyicus TaxID=1284 RepID=UPI002A82FC7C|nr:glycosyltransferase [Staphylococcus hyicus]MDY3697474.1 glycosyltransferase [Staphylococcus hyicus]